MGTRFEGTRAADTRVEVARPGTLVGVDVIGGHALVLHGGGDTSFVVEGTADELRALARLISDSVPLDPTAPEPDPYGDEPDDEPEQTADRFGGPQADPECPECRRLGCGCGSHGGAADETPLRLDWQRDEAIAAIRAGLRTRSASRWSVKAGKGSTWGWIYISSPPARRDAFGTMTADERDRLAQLLGLEPADVLPDGVYVANGGRWRAEYVDRAEGRAPRVLGDRSFD